MALELQTQTYTLDGDVSDVISMPFLPSESMGMTFFPLFFFYCL